MNESACTLVCKHMVITDSFQVVAALLVAIAKLLGEKDVTDGMFWMNLLHN